MCNAVVMPYKVHIPVIVHFFSVYGVEVNFAVNLIERYMEVTLRISSQIIFVYFRNFIPKFGGIMEKCKCCALGVYIS